MRGNVRYFQQLQPLGWAKGEKTIIKGEKKSHISRGIADVRSAPTPGDWISFFFLFPLLHAEDITKLKTL